PHSPCIFKHFASTNEILQPLTPASPGMRACCLTSRCKGGPAMYTHLTTVPETKPRVAPAPANVPVVFIIEGEAAARSALERLVTAWGWQPETFASAKEFLAHPRAMVPNCLILDVNLPDLNGLDLQKLVAAERNDMPFIFVTHSGDVSMSVKAIKA